MKLSKALVWSAAVAVVLGAGCSKDNKNEFFKGDAGEQVNRFAEIQAANGARNDGMLYTHHFNGGHLNSLGRQKVLLMLEDCDNCEPATVHLVNAGDGDLLAQRKAAVELYLKTAEGRNVSTFHTAQNDLVRYMKTESGMAAATETTVDSSATGASASGGVK